MFPWFCFPLLLNCVMRTHLQFNDLIEVGVDHGFEYTRVPYLGLFHLAEREHFKAVGRERERGRENWLYIGNAYILTQRNEIFEFHPYFFFLVKFSYI